MSTLGHGSHCWYTYFLPDRDVALLQDCGLAGLGIQSTVFKRIFNEFVSLFPAFAELIEWLFVAIRKENKGQDLTSFSNMTCYMCSRIVIHEAVAR